MAKLYRKSALERMASPEQLDKALKVTSPLSWLSLGGVTLIIVVTAIWSVVGRIPVTITTNGIIASPVNTNAVYTENAGTVDSVYVSVGDEIRPGDEVALLEVSDGSAYTIKSDQIGTASAVDILAGDTVGQGFPILYVSPEAASRQVVVCYVNVADVKKISRGMPAYVYLNSADSQRYGHMKARVINIDEYAASNKGMNYVLGEDNNLSSFFTSSGAVAAVTCELSLSEQTASAYACTNKMGK